VGIGLAVVGAVVGERNDNYKSLEEQVADGQVLTYPFFYFVTFLICFLLFIFYVLVALTPQ
jgi:hypothetical protein